MTDGRLCGRRDGHPGKHKSPEATANRRTRNYVKERAAARLRYANDPEWREKIIRGHTLRHKARMAPFRAAGCADCGTHDGELHFHHIDPSTKLFTVAQMTTRSNKLFREEVAKCVVLCEACHYERHRHMNESQRIAERSSGEQSSLNSVERAADEAA